MSDLYTDADVQAAMNAAFGGTPPRLARALREFADSALTAFGGVSVRRIRDRADELERRTP